MVFAFFFPVVLRAYFPCIVFSKLRYPKNKKKQKNNTRRKKNKENPKEISFFCINECSLRDLFILTETISKWFQYLKYVFFILLDMWYCSSLSLSLSNLKWYYKIQFHKMYIELIVWVKRNFFLILAVILRLSHNIYLYPSRVV